MSSYTVAAPTTDPQRRDVMVNRGLERATSIDAEGSTISFHDISYTVRVKDPNKRCGSMDKDILHSISGIFKPGMNAIMGSTGGGKSSLLDVLAGRKDPRGLNGLVLVDGKKQPENFKCMSGYVIQEDIILGTLTVRENLTMSANLRLPSSVSNKEKKTRVEDAINELGLTHCADSKLGTELVRGVSGGERKRTSIGMELIISPSVLFLDEPTTGLDSNTAHTVMLLLSRLSLRGRTIIFSIHQPRFSIYRFFDRLMILGRGKTVYHGPCSEALTFLEQNGYHCEEHNNPPDFFLDVLHGAVQPAGNALSDDTGGAKYGEDENRAVYSTDKDNVTTIVIASPSLDDTGKTIDKTINKIAESYNQSSYHQDLIDELQPIYKKYDKHEKPDLNPDYATSWGKQTYYLCKRTMLNTWRDPQSSVMQIILSIVMGLFCGLIYLQLGNDYPNGIENRMGAFFFIILSMIFTNMPAIELFIADRRLFLHENLSGYYRTSSYFLSKLLCDMIPVRTIPAIIYSVIVYFMLDLQQDVSKYFIFLASILVGSLAASAVNFAISASVHVYSIANVVVALVYVTMMIFGGFLTHVDDIVVWLRWLQYFSIFRYGINALSINELKDAPFCINRVDGECISYNSTLGNLHLENRGIDYKTSWDLWANNFAQGMLFLGSLLIGYIQLRRINKYK